MKVYTCGGEEQACKAGYIIYGDLNPVIHKYNYNLRLESDMDLAILIMLRLCLFRSLVDKQNIRRMLLVSKTINERIYFYFAQRILFVSVHVVYPPTFRW